MNNPESNLHYFYSPITQKATLDFKVWMDLSWKVTIDNLKRSGVINDLSFDLTTQDLINLLSEFINIGNNHDKTLNKFIPIDYHNLKDFLEYIDPLKTIIKTELYNYFIDFLFSRDIGLFEVTFYEQMKSRSRKANFEEIYTSLTNSQLMYLWFCEYRLMISGKNKFSFSIGQVFGDDTHRVRTIVTETKQLLGL